MESSVPKIPEVGVKPDAQTTDRLRRKTTSLLGRIDHTKFPGAQPVSFARKHLKELREHDFFLCEKSDGIRCLLLFVDDNGEEAHYLIDRKNDYYYVPDLHFPRMDPLNPKAKIKWESFNANTILDGELLIDKLPNGQRQLKFLVFDCLVYDGDSCLDRTLDVRLGKFSNFIFKPYAKLCEEFPEDTSRWGFKRPPPLEDKWFAFKLEEKKYFPSYHVAAMIRDVVPDLMHASDGLIFTRRDTPYHSGTDPNILKYKTLQENTVDFQMELHFPELIKNGASQVAYDYEAMPRIQLHVDPEGLPPDRWLYVTREEWDKMKAYAEEMNDGLDGQVVECHKDREGRWRFHRWRDDKTTANYRTTVESVIESIEDPVAEDELVDNSPPSRDAWKKRQEADRMQREEERKRKTEEQEPVEKRSRAS